MLMPAAVTRLIATVFNGPFHDEARPRFYNLIRQIKPGIILEVAQGVASCVKDVTFDVHPESEEQVDNHGRSHGD